MKLTYRDQILSIINEMGNKIICQEMLPIIRWINTHADRISYYKETLGSDKIVFNGKNLEEKILEGSIEGRRETLEEFDKELEKLEKNNPEFNESDIIIKVDVTGYEKQIKEMFDSLKTKHRNFDAAEKSIKETLPCDMKKIAEEIPEIKNLYDYVQKTRKEEKEQLYELTREILNEYQELFENKAS